MNTVNMVRTSAPERFLKPLRLKSLAIFRQFLDRTDEKDKNVLEFEEDCCILSMVFSCYLFDLTRNIITQNTIQITTIHMIFKRKIAIFTSKIFNSNSESK